MSKNVRTKFNKVEIKKLSMFNKISLTIISTLLFIVWLMFITGNFYPKTENNLADKIMNSSTQLLIWPVTLIILFIFIMPIWVTKSFKILLVFLILSLLILLANVGILILLNISSLWILWLVIDIISFIFIAFALFSVIYIHSKNKTKR